MISSKTNSLLSPPGFQKEFDLSPLALLAVMAVMLWMAPVLRIFGVASIAGGCIVAVVLRGLHSRDRNGTINPPADPDPDLATVTKQLGPYDKDMDDFWKKWETRTPR